MKRAVPRPVMRDGWKGVRPWGGEEPEEHKRQFAFYHQFGINTWRSKFKQKTDSILSAC